jgi:N-formylglutamate amidohydrolase
MNIIFNIPHSSTKIPKKYKKDFIIPDDELNHQNNVLCDLYVDELLNKKCKALIFKYSRLLCDVERFNSDKEIMNNVGMGVLYTHGYDKKLIRPNLNKTILKYYYKYHRKLNKLIKRYLNNEILIIDLHSYSNEILPYEINTKLNRPDICVGIDYNHYDKNITNKIIDIIKKYNFNYLINEPFSGCLIPSNYYLKNKNVHGLMIEINKNVYLTNNNKNENFYKLKEMINDINNLKF